MCKMCSIIHNTTPKTTQQHNNLHSVLFVRQVCSWQRSQMDKVVLMCSLVHDASGKISCKNRPVLVRRENLCCVCPTSNLVLLHLQPTCVFTFCSGRQRARKNTSAAVAEMTAKSNNYRLNALTQSL